MLYQTLKILSGLWRHLIFKSPPNDHPTQLYRHETYAFKDRITTLSNPITVLHTKIQLYYQYFFSRL